jgi:multiple sugar transport system permease protein
MEVLHMFQSEKAARWILSLPLIIFIVVLVGFPAVYAFFISFQNNSLVVEQSSFAGLSNYLNILGDEQFWSALLFSLKFAVLVTLIELILGFGLALLFNRVFPGKKILLSIILLPIMVAPSLMGIMYRLLLNENIGSATYLFKVLGLEVSLFSADSIVPLLILLDAIQWSPFVFLILYSGLQGIDRGYIEAAKIDGATSWHITLKILIPILLPIILITGFLRGIDAYRTFDVIYVLTSGGPGTSTTTVSIYLYKLAFKEGAFGLSAAASILIVAILFIIMPYFVKKVIKS